MPYFSVVRVSFLLSTGDIEDTNPGNHDPAHPHRRREPLQCQSGQRLEEHVWVVEDAECPCPLAAAKVTQLCPDAVSFFQVHDGGVANVADMDSHDQVDKGVPQQKTLVNLAMSRLEDLFILIIW